MNIFVINLPSAIERRQFQEKQLSRLGLDYQIIAATTINDIDNNTYKKHYYDWQRPLQKTEVACYFSHQKLWKKIVKDNSPALILEDDVVLSKYTPNLLTELEKFIDIDMVNLEVFNRKKTVARSSQPIGSHRLFYLYQDKAGAAAYVLYPSGAKKLLQCQEKHGIALADAQLHNCSALKSYQVEPACAVQLMFCQQYGIQQHDIGIIPPSIEYKNTEKARPFIFRIKRTIAQVKLGLQQLRLLVKANKRFIEMKKEDFEEREGL